MSRSIPGGGECKLNLKQCAYRKKTKEADWILWSSKKGGTSNESKKKNVRGKRDLRERLSQGETVKGGSRLKMFRRGKTTCRAKKKKICDQKKLQKVSRKNDKKTVQEISRGQSRTKKPAGSTAKGNRQYSRV